MSNTKWPNVSKWILTPAINPPALLIHDGLESEGGKLVAEVEYANGEGFKRAQLITASPDLYDALESLHEGISEHYPGKFPVRMKAAIAALAKARGENPQ